MVCVFCMLVGKLSIDIWIARAGAKVNPDDLPTRHVDLPFPVLNRAQLTRLFSLLFETQKFI